MTATRIPRGLVRYQTSGDFHFLTFSCFHRKPYLDSTAARDRFERSLERTRILYDFVVMAYVVMPEHMHLLVTEPARDTPARAMQSLKVSVSRLSSEQPFWQARYYDFNVMTDRKRIEKLRYIHRNPMKRGLVEKPEEDGHGNGPSVSGFPQLSRSTSSGLARAVCRRGP